MVGDGYEEREVMEEGETDGIEAPLTTKTNGRGRFLARRQASGVQYRWLREAGAVLGRVRGRLGRGELRASRPVGVARGLGRARLCRFHGRLRGREAVAAGRGLFPGCARERRGGEEEERTPERKNGCASHQ
jgi:hypothetical protein